MRDRDYSNGIEFEFWTLGYLARKIYTQENKTK